VRGEPAPTREHQLVVHANAGANEEQTAAGISQDRERIGHFLDFPAIALR
jgi:hypothetical protein